MGSAIQVAVQSQTVWQSRFILGYPKCRGLPGTGLCPTSVAGFEVNGGLNQNARVLWYTRAFWANVLPIGNGTRVSVKTFAVGLRRALVGLPFYVTWNLIAYIKEQRGLAAKVKTALASLLVIIIATALWAAPGVAAGWVVMQLLASE